MRFCYRVVRRIKSLASFYLAVASVAGGLALAVAAPPAEAQSQTPAKPAPPTVALRTTSHSATGAAFELKLSWTAPNDNGAVINDYDVQYRKQGASNWTSHAFSSTDTLTTISGLSAGTTYEARVRASNDVGTGAWSDSGTSSANRRPVFTEGSPNALGGRTTTREVAENTAAGQAVGTPVSATDADNDALTYSLTDPPGDDVPSQEIPPFTVDSSTGQIRVGSDANLDYESGTTTYILRIYVGDGKVERGVRGEDAITVTINVTDVAEPPGKPDRPSVARSTTDPQTALEISWTAPTNTGRPAISDYDVHYRKQGTETWITHSFTGTGTQTTITGLSPATTYEVEVRAGNADGEGDWSDVGTGSTNRPPVFTDGASTTREVDENTAAGQAVGTPVSATDADSDALTYTLSGSSAFTIDSGSGQIKVASGATLDYETTSSYSVKAAVSDGYGGTDSIAVTINVNDVDEVPGKPDAPSVARSSTDPQTALEISWTAPTNTDRSAISDYDVHYRKQGTETWITHTFTGTGTQTTITDLAVATTYEVEVRAGNAEGEGEWSDVGTGSTNRPPVFTDGASTTREVDENTAAGQAVGTPVSATDADSDALTYTLSGSSAFTIDSGSGQIKVASGATLDYETTSSYSVMAAVSDGYGGTDSIAVTINVTDVDEVPGKPDRPSVTRSTTDPQTALDIRWTAPTNTGRPAISDYDVQYRKQGVSEWTDHAFTGTGTQTTITGLSPATTYEVEVRAGNAEGEGDWSDEGTGSTNRPPVFTDGASTTREVDENTAAGQVVGTPVSATDADSDALTYTLSGSSAFTIDSGSGQIKVASGATLDYETASSYSVKAAVSDGYGGTDSISVTINVADVNEPPGKPDRPSVARSSTDPQTALEISWTAPTNTGRSAISDYDVQYRKQGASEWTDLPFTGTGTQATITGLSVATTYEVEVRAGNADGEGEWSDEGTGSTDQSPVLTDIKTAAPGRAITREVAENTPPGSAVGAPVTAIDGWGNALTYALSGSSAFTIDSGSGQIRVASGATLDYETTSSYSVTVDISDGQGNTERVAVTINVIDVDENLVPTFTDAVDFQRYLQGTAITPLVFPEATGGDGSLTYALTPPAGLIYTPPTTGESNGGVMFGVPTEPKGKTRYTLTATDEDGDAATLSFFVVVEEDQVPAFTDTVGAQSYIEHMAIAPLTLPSATGGDGTLTYALAPDLPAGLSFNRTTRVISGTPGATMVVTEYRWTATDADGDAATLTFTIEVVANRVLALANQVPAFTDTVGAQSYIEHRAIALLTLPSATGGDGTLTYALAPDLPAGLSVDQTTRVISGTPSETMVATEYHWTVTDEDGDSASLAFTIEVAADPARARANQVPAFTDTVGAQSYIEHQAIAPLTLPLATGGDGTLTYALAPDLPAGLSFDPTTRVISGTSGATMVATKYRWTATDEDGDAATLTFTIEVVPPNSVPTFTDAVDFQRYLQGTSITPLVFPEATGGDGALNYALTPPAGLTYTPPATRESNGGVMSGVPTEPKGKTRYTLTATDEDGDAATLSFFVVVEEDQVPAFTDTVGAQSYVEHQAIVPLTLPLATGGDGMLTYALAPDLASGLSFDQTTRVISGTPGETMSATEYRWRVTDEDGDTATLTFTIEVVADPVQVLVDQVPAFTDTVGPQSYVEHQAIVPLTLPLATGGDGMLTYALEPDLASGLSFNPTTRVISGTPSETMVVTEYRWTVTDEDGDTASLAFTIEVAPPNSVPVFIDEMTDDPMDDQPYEVIPPFTLPGAAGGDGVVNYDLEPPLPPGLEFDKTTRVVSGTPDEDMDDTEYNWIATDEDGDQAVLTFIIEAADLVPVFTDTVAAQQFVKNRPIEVLTLPLATGGDGALTYALTPAPSAGLKFDAATRVLSGTPTKAMAATECIYTATDEDGDAAMLVFTVEVAEDLIPVFTETVGPQRYRAGREIAPLTLPEATGGNGVLTYALTPALPAGLVLDAATRVISGVPTTPMDAMAYKWMATDEDGDRAELSFTIAIEVSDRTRIGAINELILPELSRAMRTSTLDALTGRIDWEGISPGILNSEAALSFVASKVMASEYAVKEGTWSWQEMLGGSSFAVPLSSDQADTLTAGRGKGIGALWGAGDFRRLSLRGDSPVSWDGDLFAAHLGADMRFGNGVIAGLVGSWFEGSVAYTDRGYGEAIDGTHESRMVSAHPYLGWSSPQGSNLWATAGYGRGEIATDDDEAGRQTSDSDLMTAAAGGRARLSGGLSSFDLKGEAWMTRLAIDDNGDGIEGMAANTQRVRLAGEAAHTFGFASGASLTPSMELGMRMDAGDGQTGAGVELGGGLRYAAARLTVAATSRVLLAHTGDTKEWSAGFSVRFSPKADGRGLSVQAQPSYGETSSGVTQLWEQGAMGTGLGGFEPTARMDTEVGYTVPMFTGLLTPYSGFRLSQDGARGYRFGGRMTIGGLGNVSLEGLRDEASDSANHGVMLRGSLNF